MGVLYKKMTIRSKQGFIKLKRRKISALPKNCNRLGAPLPAVIHWPPPWRGQPNGRPIVTLCFSWLRIRQQGGKINPDGAHALRLAAQDRAQILQGVVEIVVHHQMIELLVVAHFRDRLAHAPVDHFM